MFDVYSPSNATTSNINLNVLFLVVTSDFPLDNYHSVNVTDNQVMNLNSGGLFSTDFDGGMQIKIRQNIKNLIVVSLRNTDNRPYLSEPITNFTL